MDPAIEAAVRRTSQVWFELTAQRVSLPVGYAYTSRDYPDVPTCNFLGEVLLDPDDAPDPRATVEAYFDDTGRTCNAWIPAAVANADEILELVTGKGFTRDELRTFALPPDAPAPAARGEIRLVGARGLRRTFAALAEQRAAELDGPTDQLVACQLDRLNSAQVDAFVGRANGEAVGTVTVFQVGPIGRICDLWVSQAARKQGFGRELLAGAVETARRWALQPICAAIGREHEAGAALLASAGFVEGTPIVGAFRNPSRAAAFAG